jgi:hypothetical protein
MLWGSLASCEPVGSGSPRIATRGLWGRHSCLQPPFQAALSVQRIASDRTCGDSRGGLARTRAASAESRCRARRLCIAAQKPPLCPLTAPIHRRGWPVDNSRKAQSARSNSLSSRHPASTEARLIPESRVTSKFRLSSPSYQQPAALPHQTPASPPLKS